MALIEIANDSCTLAHKAGSTISGGVFVITSVASVKVKAEGGGAHKTPLLYTFSGGNSAGFVNGTVVSTGPQTIAATAVKDKVDGSLVMREGDFGAMIATGTIDPTPTPPAPPTGPVGGGTVEISDAGQTKVKAE